MTTVTDAALWLGVVALAFAALCFLGDWLSRSTATDHSDGRPARLEPVDLREETKDFFHGRHDRSTALAVAGVPAKDETRATAMAGSLTTRKVHTNDKCS